MELSITSTIGQQMANVGQQLAKRSSDAIEQATTDFMSYIDGKADVIDEQIALYEKEVADALAAKRLSDACPMDASQIEVLGVLRAHFEFIGRIMQLVQGDSSVKTYSVVPTMSVTDAYASAASGGDVDAFVVVVSNASLLAAYQRWTCGNKLTPLSAGTLNERIRPLGFMLLKPGVVTQRYRAIRDAHLVTRDSRQQLRFASHTELVDAAAEKGNSYDAKTTYCEIGLARLATLFTQLDALIERNELDVRVFCDEEKKAESLAVSKTPNRSQKRKRDASPHRCAKKQKKEEKLQRFRDDSLLLTLIGHFGDGFVRCSDAEMAFCKTAQVYRKQKMASKTRSNIFARVPDAASRCWINIAAMRAICEKMFVDEFAELADRFSARTDFAHERVTSSKELKKLRTGRYLAMRPLSFRKADRDERDFIECRTIDLFNWIADTFAKTHEKITSNEKWSKRYEALKKTCVRGEQDGYEYLRKLRAEMKGLSISG